MTLLIFGLLASTLVLRTSAYNEQAVCEICTLGDDESCNQFPGVTGQEECVDLGDGVPRCYWANTSAVDLVQPYDRRCSSDWECVNQLDGHEYDSCLRCCPDTESGIDLCTETISTGSDECGSSWGSAPCCPGDVCIHPEVSICGGFADICEPCNDGKAVCGEGLVCITDGSSGSIILGDRKNRRRSLLQTITLETGFCGPAEGVQAGTCEEDSDCPSCLRCCGGECMRIRGDVTMFCGSERGPCCCEEDECCDNECVEPTPFPSKAPTDKPTKGPTVKPTDKTTKGPTVKPTRRHSGDNGGNGDDGSGSEEESLLFGGLMADGMKKDDSVHSNDGISNQHIVVLSSSIVTLLVSVALILFTVVVAVCYCRSGPPKAMRVRSESNV